MNRELIREAILFGFSIACSECCWQRSDCPIAKLAERYDENFNVFIFCRFNFGKVVDGIIESLEKELKENKKV